MKKVLCILPVQQRHKDKLESSGKGCEFIYVPEDQVTAGQAADANIIIGAIEPGLLNAYENLELLQLSSAGAVPYVRPGVLAKNTLLTNATGAYSKAVAEHAMAMTMMLQKKLYLYRDAQRQKSWSDFGTVTSIADATVLVAGLGDIGRHYAGMARALGAYVIGVKRRPSEKPDCVDELYTMEHIDELLPRADVIFTILPGTDANSRFFTKERFELMKSTALFVNCGRGNAAAHDVLLEALTTGQIAAAAADVTDPEPLPADSPLWTLDNMVITPHVSGFYHLPETFERIIDISADNLHRYLNGIELRNIVDFKTGYKK